VIEIRDAEPSEYATVGELTVAAYALLPVDHLWGGYAADIRDTAARAELTEIIVGTLDGELAGAVTYVPDATSPWSEWSEPGEAQFRLLAVAGAARRQGVGEGLTRECIRRAGGAGRPIVIHTSRWLTTAHRIYARLGFERRPDRDVPYAVWNSPPVADLPLEWIGEPFLAYSWRAESG
jgi:GNAT superfamily N-acetyltransferase